MSNGLFRKSSLDGISSPEQLKQYARVASPGVWMIVAALLLALAGVAAWMFFGTLPSRAELRGVILSDGTAVCLVSSDDALTLKPGQSAEVSPDGASGGDCGSIVGTVDSVGSEPELAAEVSERLGAPWLADVSGSGKWIITVTIRLERDETSSNGLRWTDQNGGNISLGDGASCTADVVVREWRPYELLFR